MITNRYNFNSALIYFFVVYGISIVLFDMILRPMQFILAITVLILFFILLNKLTIDRIIIKYGILILLYFIYSVYIYFFGNYHDSLLIKGNTLYVVIFFSAIFLSKYYFSKISEIDLLKIIFYSTIVYSFFIVLMASFEIIKVFFYSFIPISDYFLEKAGTYRIISPNGLKAAYLSVVLTVGMISGLLIRQFINKILFWSGIVVILCAILYSGRTGLLLLILLSPLIMSMQFRKIKNQIIYFNLIFISLIFFALFIYLNIDLIASLSPALKRLLDSLIPLLEGRISEVPTIKILMDTHYFLPNNPLEIIFGTGSMGRSEINFISSDVGYVRTIFSTGIIGSILLYSIYFFILIKSFQYMKNSLLMKYTFIISLIVFIYHSKEISMGTMHLSFMLFVPFFTFLYKLKNQKKENCNETIHSIS
tara:strand:- start:26067 stop:27329 length:1263 start_codon:yes stop_codon:yes gene_type:complete